MYQLDLNISRRIPVKEGMAFELRCDAFNIFNHASFSNPPSTLPNALPALQPGQRFSATTAPGFGVITSTIGRSVGLGTARQFDLSLRFTF